MRIALFFLCLLQPLAGRAELCKPDLKAGEECSVHVRNLRPTQFGIGMVDVEEKQWEVYEGGKAYLKENRAEVVIGPGGKYYMVDRHHTIRAAYDEGFQRVYAVVVENLSGLSQAEFESEMVKRNWVRLLDEKGLPKTFADLPKHVKDLKDDPYRSLAWLVRQSEAFSKSTKPFAEFEWADYFRDRIKIGRGAKGWDEAVKEGIRLATILETSHLPGHRNLSPASRSSRRESCWEIYNILADDLIR